jgi:Zn-finger nucleic acid-binding protein
LETIMKCPACDVELTMSERNGIEIDYCPKCRGVWLDRGELDKIIDRSGTPDAPTSGHSARGVSHVPPPPPPARRRDDDDDDFGDFDEDRRRYGEPRQRPYPKKRSFLSELFD